MNDTLNAALFDGHVQNLDNLASRKVSYWFSSKSVVVEPPMSDRQYAFFTKPMAQHGCDSTLARGRLRKM